MARTAEASRELVSPDEAKSLVNVKEFLKYKAQNEASKKAMAEFQPGVMRWLESSVEPDEDGNREYELPEKIEGYARLKLIVARSTKRADDETIYRILREKNLIDTCTRTVTVIDDDAIAQAAMQGRLSDEEMSEMFPIQEQRRLMTPKK